MAKPPVCRKLFRDDNGETGEEENGPEETAALEQNARNFLNEEMQQDFAEKCLRWNFNFQDGIPLAGDWDWEKMMEDEPDGDVEVKDVVESAPNEPVAPPGESTPHHDDAAQGEAPQRAED